MASGTIPLSKLIQYSLAIEAVREDGDWFMTNYADETFTPKQIREFAEHNGVSVEYAKQLLQLIIGKLQKQK